MLRFAAKRLGGQLALPACVLNGDMTTGQAVKEFMDTFDFNSSSAWITFEDFLEYYTSISATISDDSVFSLMIWQVWLSGKRR